MLSCDGIWVLGLISDVCHFCGLKKEGLEMSFKLSVSILFSILGQNLIVHTRRAFYCGFGLSAKLTVSCTSVPPLAGYIDQPPWCLLDLSFVCS